MEDLIERIILTGRFGEDAWTVIVNAIREGKIHTEGWEDVVFLRFEKDIKGLKRGTVVTHEGLIHAYPRINRIMRLEEGIKRNLSVPFYVEEKVDGYNVRVVCVDSRVVVFTRGGFVCPFATDRVDDFMELGAFFNDHPGLVLCCEVAGPHNPYNTESPPYIKEDVRFFVFDIMERDTGRILPPDERYRLVEEYGLPGIRVFGRYTSDEWQRVKDIVVELHRDGLEGVVLKPVDRSDKTLKYVTPFSLMHDLRIGAFLIKELPAGYFTKRITLTAFALKELDIGDGGWFDELGRSLMVPLWDAMEVISKGSEIVERFSIRMKKEENIQRLFSHLASTHLRFEVISREEKDGYFHVTFNRIYTKTSSFIRGTLRGKTFVD